MDIEGEEASSSLPGFVLPGVTLRLGDIKQTPSTGHGEKLSQVLEMGLISFR